MTYYKNLLIFYNNSKKYFVWKFIKYFKIHNFKFLIIHEINYTLNYIMYLKICIFLYSSFINNI